MFNSAEHSASTSFYRSVKWLLVFYYTLLKTKKKCRHENVQNDVNNLLILIAFTVFMYINSTQKIIWYLVVIILSKFTDLSNTLQI